MGNQSYEVILTQVPPVYGFWSSKSIPAGVMMDIARSGGSVMAE